ncbi:MAG: hypothetical protein ACI9LO_000252 [Planctomycetota bacterium]|jgi:hypothetical protein
MTKIPTEEQPAGPWNPDIKSALPSEYLHLATIFRTENVSTSIATATELGEFTGLPIQQLVCFLPQRLVVHELLLRVSADIFVSDGSRYEDLGVNFRNIIDKILRQYIEPHMSGIIDRFNQVNQQAAALIDVELECSVFASPATAASSAKAGGLFSFFSRSKKSSVQISVDSISQREQQWLSSWARNAENQDDAITAHAYRALAKIGTAIIARHGRLRGDKALLMSLATGQFSNVHGSSVIGEAIAPFIDQAVEAEGYLRLPIQKNPVVFNVKGASAAGKSTMRPLLHQQADKLGLNWQEFALISPDIWRKYLLDYDALGAAYKYAGTLAGDEVPIIDKKLDRYIDRKANTVGISHLLIDRFRFDSFAAGKDKEEGSNLLTRFGQRIYLIFMVTPPEATVERAWIRGLQVGRYKAVDDLLDHNVEAYKGIPVLFFTWALRQDKLVYYEFLDNSVEKGEIPRTIAFGVNGEMYIIDFKCMINIVRYTRINIEATCPAEIYLRDNDSSAVTDNDFLVKCAHQIPTIYFVDKKSEKIYACMESAKMLWVDNNMLGQKRDDADFELGLEAMAPGVFRDLKGIPQKTAQSVPEPIRHRMIGAIDNT